MVWLCFEPALHCANAQSAIPLQSTVQRSSEQPQMTDALAKYRAEKNSIYNSQRQTDSVMKYIIVNVSILMMAFVPLCDIFWLFYNFFKTQQVISDNAFV